MREKNNKSKNLVRLASWNIITILIPGNMEEIAREMNEHKRDTLALQEIRWKGTNEVKKKDYMLILWTLCRWRGTMIKWNGGHD